MMCFHVCILVMRLTLGFETRVGISENLQLGRDTLESKGLRVKQSTHYPGCKFDGCQILSHVKVKIGGRSFVKKGNCRNLDCLTYRAIRK